jgi:hypothetical protein
MSILTNLCPICGKHELQYSQSADINFKLVDNRLRAMLSLDEISFFDDTSLYCIDCGASDDMDDEIYYLKQKYDQLMIDKVVCNE